MRRLVVAPRSCALDLAVLSLLASRCFAFWPFGDNSDDGAQQKAESGLPPDFPQGILEGMPLMGLPQGMPRLAFGSAPVVVVRGHFGFDPWEDLHHNMQRVIQDSHGTPPNAVHGGDADGRHLVAKPLHMQLDNLLGAFGDHHAGHVGRAEGSFQVDDDHHTRFRITAELPGYNFGDSRTLHPAAESPLSVRAIGHRSLVVSGSQQNGPFIRTWQRTFSLPKGTDIDHISVTYSSKTGNLTVDVPRKNKTETSGDEEEEEAEEDDGSAEIDEMLPPALRAIRQGLPDLLNQLTHGGGPIQMRSVGGNSLRGKAGFLVPASQLIGPDLAQMLGTVGQMHPRFQLPQGGERPLPEDAEVTLVGCFAESQLEKIDLKYYGEANAASFNAMFWHARADHVPYFAMSRHGEPLGHAFTAHGFVHEGEKPKWGVYDGCGSRCIDDENRWCGCSNEATRGFPNTECSEGDSEKRFAVYKIIDNLAMAPENASSETSMNASMAAVAPSQSVAHGRPYWQLTNDDVGKEPEIEIVVPKGTVAKAQGRQVLLYNTSDASSNGATPLTTVAEPRVGGTTEGHAVEIEASTTTGAAPMATEAAAAPTAAPIGKMRLPVGVSQEDCTWEPGRVNEDGSQVMKCKIAQNAVKQVPIKVIDEL